MNEKEKLLNIAVRATGIGSMPHVDTDAACGYLLQKFSDIPCWPQMVQADFREGMLIQYTENFPCLKIDAAKKDIYYDKSADRDAEILNLFDNLSRNNLGHFAISRDFGRGFHSLLEKSRTAKNPFIKGQVVGPVTLLLSITGGDGKAVIHDDILSDALIRGLALKGAWQAKKIREAGKIPVIFFDEPSLTGFGSAFMPLDRNRFLEIFDRVISTVREHDDALIGLHCCGNSDWDVLLESGIDILSFDAFDFGKYFVLYPERVKKFLERDGILSWGAVPTSAYTDQVTIDVITGRFEESLKELTSKGIDRDLILGRSIFTPACGMGSLSVNASEKIIDLTRAIAEKYRGR